jgi:hypothetical protein
MERPGKNGFFIPHFLQDRRLRFSSACYLCGQAVLLGRELRLNWKIQQTNPSGYQLHAVTLTACR